MTDEREQGGRLVYEVTLAGHPWDSLEVWKQSAWCNAYDAIAAEVRRESAEREEGLRESLISLLDAISPWCPSCGPTPPPMKHGPDCPWAVVAGIAASDCDDVTPSPGAEEETTDDQRRSTQTP